MMGEQKKTLGKIIKNITRPDSQILKELQKFSTTIISDCLQRFRVMDSAIKPIIPGRQIVGPAITVEEIEGGNLMSHFALNLIQEGDIIVIDQKGIESRSGWGGVQTYVCKRKKAAGVIVDGAVRDAEDIHAFGVPVFSRAISAAGPHKGWGGNINKTISCGGVSVSPGDIVVADDNGVVVFDPKDTEYIIEACHNRLKKEKQWFQWIDEGQATTDFMGFNKKLKEFGIEIEE